MNIDNIIDKTLEEYPKDRLVTNIQHNAILAFIGDLKGNLDKFSIKNLMEYLRNSGDLIRLKKNVYEINC